MKKLIVTIFFALTGLAFASGLSAQTIPEGYEEVDSLVYRQVAVVDSVLAGKNIFAVLPSKAMGDEADVNVRQSQEIMNSMRAHVGSNAKRTMNG
jgi:hypothetical protein